MGDDDILIQLLARRGEKLLSKIPFGANLYTQYYQQVVQKEITLAQITNNDVILNIGCGAVPFTAIYLALLTKAKVWAVDKDRKAIEQARCYCNKIGLREQIKFIIADGSKGIPLNFTVAIVALQAEPKELLLDNLLKATTQGGRLVFRKPSKKFKDHYDHLPKDYPFTGMVKQNMKTFDSSVLYVK
ncbi:MAG: methyltransferase domain-containing protein [Clostridiales bacterium]|nr:methyltransferase domain-containing protein [Clostridiales bacterium]